MAVTNVKTSDGVYTFSEFGNTYKYYADSRALYMVTYYKGDPSYHFEKSVDSDLDHQKLLDRLNGTQNNPVIPVITEQPERINRFEDIGVGFGGMDPPKYVPDIADAKLGTVPMTMRYRVGGIGVCPGIGGRVDMDRSKIRETFSFSDMPKSPEELREYIEQYFMQVIKKPMPSPVRRR